MTNKKFKLAAMSLATAVAVSTVGPSASAVTYYLGDGSVTVLCQLFFAWERVSPKSISNLMIAHCTKKSSKNRNFWQFLCQ